MKLDILIVEDDFLIALDLEDQVRSLGHRVTGVARDVESCPRRDPGTRPGTRDRKLDNERYRRAPDWAITWG
ncbi:hypothetical protein E5163_08825 [Marinicauda algicola]|uniref:Response regulator n=1 Tax=Marinicauda algicola TaxID=2029849 RepID=A0A4S2H1R3_9PROT|nr:hypothetical protein [Marinicauda algicola]TGY89211.1 hypothetical protein E5163_08825 [Marinicauda algicola]